MLQCTTQETPAEPRSIDLALASGRIRGRRWGSEGGRLTLLVHGLSANSRSFDAIAPELAKDGRSVVAIDLRGRGHSDVTGPGTYGWPAHAADVLAVATALGAETFDYVGHSMGAFIGMQVARTAPERVERLVLIDAVGVPEPASLVPIAAALARLGTVHRDADAYVAKVRDVGTIAPWGPVWEAHYRYDLVDVADGVTPRTSRAAVDEDLAYGGKQTPSEAWRHLVMPTLLLRASNPLGEGFIVRESDRDAFLLTAPRAISRDVAANHYGIMTHPHTVQSIRRFFS